MKRILMTIAAAAMALLAVHAEEKTMVYDFGEITSIDAGYNYEIHVTEGRSDKVKVVFDSEVEDLLEVRYSSNGKRLTLFAKNNISQRIRNGRTVPVHVYLEMRYINTLSLSGAAKADFTGSFKTENLDLDVSGAAGVSGLEIEGITMDADCSGAADVYLTGTFMDKVDLDISGAAKMVYDGDSKALDADVSGASKFKCSGRFDECEVKCNGASSATLSGKASAAEYECTGASSIDAQDFIVKNVDVELAGASKAKVHATGELRHNVSRASKMTWFGNAKIIDLNNDSNIVKGN